LQELKPPLGKIRGRWLNEIRNMFNLEQSIADWRRQMLAAGIKTPAPLEELESHLRDEIERQMKSGLGVPRAFDTAVQSIGSATELKMEFKKTSEPFEARLVELMGIGCGVVAFLFSLWILLFLFTGEADPRAKLSGLAAIATAALGWRYNHKFLPVIRNRFIRTVIGLVCCVGCVVWIQLFIKQFAPNLVMHPETPVPLVENQLREDGFGPRFSGVNEPQASVIAGQQIGQARLIRTEFEKQRDARTKRELSHGLLMAGFLWGWAFMAFLGGIGHGLEKAVRKTNEQYA